MRQASGAERQRLALARISAYIITQQTKNVKTIIPDRVKRRKSKGLLHLGITANKKVEVFMSVLR